MAANSSSPSPRNVVSSKTQDRDSSMVSRDSQQNPNPNSGPNEPSLPSSSALLYLSFCLNGSHFVAGTTAGFFIYMCDPFNQVFKSNFSRGIGLVQLIPGFDILALVGGGPDPKYETNEVRLWDERVGRCIGELRFRSEVKSVRLRRDLIVVVLLLKVYVYELENLKVLHQIATDANPKGICEVSQVSGSATMLLVFPGEQPGQVRVEYFETKNRRRSKCIQAHDSKLSCLALTNNGRLLATSSCKGTLVRVFNTFDRTLLQEVRRGADKTEIYSLAFSPFAEWLAVSSEKGTVHVFGLKVDSSSLESARPEATSDPRNQPATTVSRLGFLRGVLPKYFSSEWSFAQFRLPKGLRHTVAFGQQKNTLVVLDMDGSFYRCEFNPMAGGEMKLLENYNFLEPGKTC